VTGASGEEKQQLTFRVYFGNSNDSRFDDLGRRTFEYFLCPILEIEAHARPTWEIFSMRPMSIRSIAGSELQLFRSALRRYTQQPWRARKVKSPTRYTLAVLYDPKEKLPPSDRKALHRLAKVGNTLGIGVELITRKDYGRLTEFDALFIRETTALDHYTYRFAKKAESEGIPVIDDPTSILRCTNKVYLAEVLRRRGIPTPRTVILDRSRLKEVAEEVAYPAILKIPDGSFSRGVFKAGNREELERIAKEMFDESDVILVQEYMYTEFDWRVGVLDGRPLFVSQYRMPKKHWQIIKYEKDGQVQEGGYKTLDVAQVPQRIIQTAVAAAGTIGDGFYGVDLKETPEGVYVIEVNDNPNVDAGVEDAVLKDELYRAILRDFIRRIEAPRISGLDQGRGRGTEV
jgi:glutathione synthase/RimK-type ligase-like ATP-grasp enzyme